MQNTINVKEGIFSLKYLKDGTIALIDQRSTLRIVDPITLKTLDGFKAKLIHEHRILNIVDISVSGKYTCIGIPNKNKAALFVNETKKLKATLGIHKGDIEAVSISDDDQYVATGGTDGRTFIYQMSSSSPFIALAPHKDYITTINFSDDSRLIAIGSFDRTISVKNISLMSDDFTLIGHNAPVKKLLFLSQQFLVSTDRDGGIIVWDLHARKLKVRLPKMLEEILAITLSEDKRFLFVSTVAGNIGLYDLKEFECVTNRYLKVKGRVNALAVDHKEKMLIYGTQEGDLGTHPLLHGEEELITDLEQQEYASAYDKVKNNIMLSFSDHFKALENAWEKALSQAKQLFGKGMGDTAVRILEPFTSIPGKQTVIKNIVTEFEDFEKFKTLIDDKKYALAYPLAARHPLYVETPEYKALEALWEKQFAKAKKAILEKSGEEQARKFLAPFRGVSHKAKLITALFNERKVYTLFKHKFAQKDFRSIFQLAKTYPWLVEFKEFQDLKKWGDIIYIRIQEAYAIHDYLSAIKYAQLIQYFPDFKDEISDLVDHSQVYIAFKQAIESGDLAQVYKLLEYNSFLADLPGIRGLDKKWEAILSKIKLPISQGDIEMVLALIKPYKYIHYKMRHIIVFIKNTYMTQLEAALANGEPIEKMVKGFKNLYALFGQDELLMSIVGNYEKVHRTTVDFSHVKIKTLHMSNLDTLKMNIFE